MPAAYRRTSTGRNASKQCGRNGEPHPYKVETIIVMPCLFKRSSISQNSTRETGSTPVVGSSRKNFGAVNQSTAQCQLLFHTSGQFSCFPFFKRFYLNINVVNQVIVGFYRSIKHGSKEIQVLRPSDYDTTRNGRACNRPSYVSFIITHDIQTTDGSRPFIRQQ